MIWLFYQFALFFQDSYISPTWSFGQIIAVTIWAPCVVEYIDIEINGIEAASKYRFLAPIKMIRSTVQHPENFAILESGRLGPEVSSTPLDIERGALVRRNSV